jgi:hypothetical protein
MIIRFKWNLVLLFFGLCNCSSGMITAKKSPPDCFLFQLDCMDFPWFLEACICSLRNAPYISSKTWICHILVDKKLAVDKHANSPCFAVDHLNFMTDSLCFSRCPLRPGTNKMIYMLDDFPSSPTVVWGAPSKKHTSISDFYDCPLFVGHSMPIFLFRNIETSLAAIFLFRNTHWNVDLFFAIS